MPKPYEDEMDSIGQKAVESHSQIHPQNVWQTNKGQFHGRSAPNAELLGEQPYMGKIEPYLAHRPVKYRSIVVNRLNKIVYRIDDDAIRIVAFWDTRREPKKQAEQVE